MKPRPLSYVISHGEPATTLLIPIHLRSKDQSTYLLVVTTALQRFFSLPEQLFPFFKSLVYAPFVQIEHVWEPESSSLFNAFPLAGFNDVVSV